MAGCIVPSMRVGVANSWIASDSLRVAVPLGAVRGGSSWGLAVKGGVSLGGRVYVDKGNLGPREDNKNGRLFSSPSVGGCEFM